MTAWPLLVFALLAVADWVAVGCRTDSIRPVAKPGSMVALILVALLLEPFDAGIRTIFVIGLGLSLAGDVFLMLNERWFVAGLASFLLAHIAYIAGMVVVPTEWWAVAVGLGVVVMAFHAIGRRIVGAVGTGTPELVMPVIAYVAVISAMVVVAFGTGSVWAAGGAFLFYTSDSILAWNRFVTPTRSGPVMVMATYHLAQAGLVAWLAFG